MSFSYSRTWNAAVLSSGQFFVAVSGIILAAILARLFSKQDYAAYRQTLLAYYVVVPLLSLGLPNALYYFIPRDRGRARSIVTGNLLMLTLMGALFSIGILCGGNVLLARRFDNPAVSDLLLLYSPYAIFALPVSAAGTCLLSCGRTGMSAIFNVAARVLTLACVISFVLINASPRVAVFATVLGEFAVFIIALWLMYKITPGADWRPQIGNVWEQVKFGVPIGLASMIGVLSRSVDKVVVSSMCSPEEFAIYVNGAVDIPLIGIVTGSVTAVLLPEIVQKYSRGEAPAALALWKRAAVKCSVVLLPSMFFLFVMAPEVMRVLFSREYAASATPFRMYLLLIPIRIVAWGPMLMAAGKSSWILSRTAVSLGVNVILSIILVRYIGYMGAIVGSICELYLWAVPFCAVSISKLYKCPLRQVLPLRGILLITCLSAAACLVFLAKPSLPRNADLLKLTVCGVLYVLAYVAFGLMAGVIRPASLWAVIGACQRGCVRGWRRHETA